MKFICAINNNNNNNIIIIIIIIIINILKEGRFLFIFR